MGHPTHSIYTAINELLDMSIEGVTDVRYAGDRVEYNGPILLLMIGPETIRSEGLIYYNVELQFMVTAVCDHSDNLISGQMQRVYKMLSDVNQILMRSQIANMVVSIDESETSEPDHNVEGERTFISQTETYRLIYRKRRGYNYAD